MRVTSDQLHSQTSRGFAFGYRLAVIAVALFGIGTLLTWTNHSAKAALLPAVSAKQAGHDQLERPTVQSVASSAKKTELAQGAVATATLKARAVTVQSELGVPEELKEGIDVDKPGNPAPRQLLPHRNAYKYIVVDLSEQRVYAKIDGVTVFTDLVSTGLTGPTLIGHYKVMTKIPVGCMSGPGYSLCNIHYIMYYDGAGRSLHEAWWHNNFGHPMSHGCVNMRYATAKWFYEFARVGTDIYIKQ
ncbi:MAG: L,D-transpeptidase [Candidatus Andersenbacteria bacterium]